MINKLFLFIFSLLSFFKKKICPDCNYNIKKKIIIIDKKYNLKLIECPKCSLRFVHPVSFNLSNIYYDLIYKDGHTTEINNNYLEYLKNNVSNKVDISFKNKISRYLNIYIPIFKKFHSHLNKDNSLDFGSSWGYGSNQFKKLKPNQYKKLLGFEHPNFISDDFLKKKFEKKFKFKIFSTPMEQDIVNINLNIFNNFNNEIYNMQHYEIIFIGKKIA